MSRYGMCGSTSPLGNSMKHILGATRRAVDSYYLGGRYESGLRYAVRSPTGIV